MKFKALLIMFLVSFLTACPGDNRRTILECGGGMQFRCPKGMFCDFGASCGGFDATGECRVQPTDCPDEQNEVCGCDGKTYANACYSLGSGVSVAYEGSCIEK